MSEPQHPQPHDTDTNEGHPAPVARAVVQPVVQSNLDSLAAAGARLSQLRESKGWSIEDVSARLKVSVTKLRALESGDISHLPDTTFALGVVRSYAKMVGADPTPFTQALRRETGVPAPDLSMPASSGKDLPRGRVSLSLGGGQKSRSWLWGVAAVVVAVIALAMWHTNGGDSTAWLARLKASANGATGTAAGASGAVAQGPSAAAAAEEGASAPEAALAAAENAASATPMPAPLATGTAPSSAPAVTAMTAAPKAGSQGQVATGASAPAVVVAGASAAPTTPAAGEAIVALRVTQDSWFSVRGKDGKEVFSGLVHAGDTKEVTGEGPFKITLGNRAGLESLTLDGEPVDPAKYSSAKGNVARFALP
ncbi:helix-turn-helix domain-containing protein [Burkholderia sp. SG-MS1]|uniref:helix-turn-helix domain-containing protein n=1 Tax=Paraburkholderia sp. SG-MS1 TaxID=2023741 RepID=UPI00144766AC|nr:helix-turn-helix domain-containing protein [Paraburkholderia sp. SG-MS1]NKJ50940.1 helix-turn-helix domain-containing protein [Paraburkholderia sp. SG-MS1]